MKNFLNSLNSLAGKFRHEAEVTCKNSFQKNGEINHSLQARGDINLSAEEMETAAFCIEYCVKNITSKKIVYNGNHDGDRSCCRCPHCDEDLTWVWEEDCDYKYCPYCGKPIKEDWDFRKQR